MIIDEDHPKFHRFIRALWRRIEPYKNDFEKDLPTPIPVVLRASTATALLVFDDAEDGPVNVVGAEVLRLIEEDPHQWSTRPCHTCTTISNLTKVRFGCVRLEYEKRMLAQSPQGVDNEDS